MFSRTFWCRFADIKDGTSNTIAMSEGMIGPGGDIMWDVSRRDPSYRVTGTGSLTQSPAITDGSTFTNSAVDMATIRSYYDSCLAMYDGGGGFFGDSDELGRFWTAGRMGWGPHCTTFIGPNAGPACDRDTSATAVDVRDPSSYHPGGAQALRGDGSVEFVSETIDQAVFIALGTIVCGKYVWRDR